MAKTPILAALPLVLSLTITAAARAAPQQAEGRAYGNLGVVSSGTVQPRPRAERSARPVMPHLTPPIRDDIEDPLAIMHFE